MSETLAALTDILLQPRRQFGTIIPNVVVEEDHNDSMAITEHPVEIGAPIADHAYLRPAEVKVRCGWSPSAPALDGVLGTILPITQGLLSGINQLFNGGPDYLQSVYQALLALQATREPFTLVTGKRRYENMLIESLGVTTDRSTEYVLSVNIAFRQVIIVYTTTTTVAAQDQQAAPADTAPTRNAGTQQPQATSAPGGSEAAPLRQQSWLKMLFGG